MIEGWYAPKSEGDFVSINNTIRTHEYNRPYIWDKKYMIVYGLHSIHGKTQMQNEVKFGNLLLDEENSIYKDKIFTIFSENIEKEKHNIDLIKKFLNKDNQEWIEFYSGDTKSFIDREKWILEEEKKNKVLTEKQNKQAQLLKAKQLKEIKKMKEKADKEKKKLDDIELKIENEKREMEKIQEDLNLIIEGSGSKGTINIFFKPIFQNIKIQIEYKGLEIFTKVYEKEKNIKREILSNLPNGEYIITIKVDKWTITKEIVLKDSVIFRKNVVSN